MYLFSLYFPFLIICSVLLSPITRGCSLLFGNACLFPYTVKTAFYLYMFVVRPGNVRNIIQQFENNTEIVGEDGSDAAEAQRLSSSSLGDDSVER